MEHNLLVLMVLGCLSYGFSGWMSKDEREHYRDRARKMFYHGYDNYLAHAFPYDELQPLTCRGQNTWGSYSLTLIDALDTLLIMGNTTEFGRVSALLESTLSFEKDINVSVFETNIRVIGGLLAAHLLQWKAGVSLNESWPCDGPLLDLAVQAAEKLLPAFNTSTGMPYGTVNFMHGVPEGETPITCTASIGTFVLEFGTLSYLTGDDRFQRAALKALDGLWRHRSSLGLVGNHIDVQKGVWTAVDAGIGAGVDSYFEYLVKGALMFSNPELFSMFQDLNRAVHKHLKFDDWYVWAHMENGGITMPMFQSLDAYWPGIQVLTGDIGEGARTLYKYHQVWKQYGGVPEFYQLVSGKPLPSREGYPLRPELIESAMYLYQATKDPYFLEVGRDMLEAIEKLAWTPCGYATLKNVETHQQDDRMESFFLAETTKYLFLLFDEDNFIHKSDGSRFSPESPLAGSGARENGSNEALKHEDSKPRCPIGSAGYIFNTEAHPLDMAAVHCCKNLRDTSRSRAGFNGSQREKLLTGRYKCKRRPFHQRFFGLGAFIEDKYEIFQNGPPYHRK